METIADPGVCVGRLRGGGCRDDHCICSSRLWNDVLLQGAKPYITYTGVAWVNELREGNPTRIFDNFRMTKSVFDRFCEALDGLLPSSPWARVNTEEAAAMFMLCVSRKASNRDLEERFQRSGETVHRHFHAMLDAVCSLATQYIVLPDEPSSILHENPKFGTPFAYCRLAFDGTHIPAFVSASKAKPFRNRNGKLTQNVFAACTFDMKFAFVLCGWEGSAADPTVLADARRRGFTTPNGLFDLGDA